MEGKSDTTMLKQDNKELTKEEKLKLDHMTNFFSQDLRHMDPSTCTKEELELYEAIAIFHRSPLKSKACTYMGLQDKYGSSATIRDKFGYLFKDGVPKYNKVINKLCGDVRDIFQFMRRGELKEQKGELNNYLFAVFNHPYYIKEGERTNDKIQEDLVKARKMAEDYLAYNESLYIEDFIKEYGLTKDEFYSFRALLLVHDRPTYDEIVKKYRDNVETNKKSIEKRMKRIKAVSEGKYVFPNEFDKDIYVMSLLPRCNEEDLAAFGLPPSATLKNNFTTLYKYFFKKVSNEVIRLAIDNIVVKGSYTLSHTKMTKQEALDMKFCIGNKKDLEEENIQKNGVKIKIPKPKEEKEDKLELSKEQKEKIIKYIEARHIEFSSRIFVLFANSILRYGRDMDKKYFILRKDADIHNAIGKKENASVFVKAKKIAKHVPNTK